MVAMAGELGARRRQGAKGSVLYSAYSEEGQQLNGWVESNGVWTESWFHVKRQERSTEATSRVLLIGAAFS